MMSFSADLRNARSIAIVTAIGADGELQLYDGSRPASGGAVTVLLATLALSTVAGSVNSQVLTLNPISNDISADADGVATWGRIVTAAGDFVIDLDCGMVASTAELKFGDVNFTSGDAIKIVSFKIYEGNP